MIRVCVCMYFVLAAINMNNVYFFHSSARAPFFFSFRWKHSISTFTLLLLLFSRHKTQQICGSIETNPITNSNNVVFHPLPPPPSIHQILDAETWNFVQNSQEARAAKAAARTQGTVQAEPAQAAPA